MYLLDQKQASIRVYLGNVDFRKSIDGLSQLVADETPESVFSGTVFVFVSRDRTRIKCLKWDLNGFVLWMKRLEKRRYGFKPVRESGLRELSESDFLLWLSGVDIFSRFEALSFTCVR